MEPIRIFGQKERWCVWPQNCETPQPEAVIPNPALDIEAEPELNPPKFLLQQAGQDEGSYHHFVYQLTKSSCSTTSS